MAFHTRLHLPRRGGNPLKACFLILFAAILAALAVLFFLLFETEPPVLSLAKEPRFLGGRVELPLEARDEKSGIRSLRMELIQGERIIPLIERDFPRQAWFGKAGPVSVQEKIVIDTRQAKLAEGAAQLRIQIRDHSIGGLFRGNLTEKVLPVTVDTQAPDLAPLHISSPLQPGATGVAVYTLSEPASHHGMLIGSTFFQGFSTGQGNRQIVYFALPWNAALPQNATLTATDEAGNEKQVPCAPVFKKAEERRDSINISEAFLQRKIPEFEQHYPELRGSLAEKYVYVNSEIRKQNDQVIIRACSRPDAHQLWSGRFLRMPGAPKARYADQRSYYYNGTIIDTQTHLGVDIASTAQAEVRAANRGRVAFAGYLGIYGNMVLLDHGQGLFSLYSHLSRIDTAEGTLVEKNQPLGRTGTTGMAGGDHLHFSMLIHGVFVTPVEWWDQHWIDVTVNAALNAR